MATVVSNVGVEFDDDGNIITPGEVDGRDLSTDGSAVDSRLPSADESAALQNANSPDAANPFATMNDLGSGGPATTDDLPEGSTNEYYTDGKVAAAPAVVANTAKVSADGSVTSHNDVTDAGSGEIITAAERTNLGNAIRTNASAQISALTEKVSPVDDDFLLGEDSENSDSKIKIRLSNLPTGSSGVSRSGSTADNAVMLWNGNDADSAKGSGISCDSDDRLAGQLSTVTEVSGTSDSLGTSDSGQVVYYTSASNIAVTLSDTALVGTTVLCIAGSTGQLEFTASGTGSIQNKFGHLNSEGDAGDQCLLRVVQNSGGSSAVWHLSGDTGV